MNELATVLRDLQMEPFDPEGATMIVAVYHPQSMDEPMAQTHVFHPQELASNSNRSLADIVTETLDFRLVDILSKWRGT